MNSACTIIPTHPPHFKFAFDALYSYNINVKGDLYFIFSNNMEYELFKSKTTEDFNYLILEKPFTEYKNRINAKKFFGVNELLTKYKYIAIFDSETEFVKPYDEYTEYKKIFESRQFKSNNSSNGTEITNSILDILQLSKTQKDLILRETDNLNQYWWFNEACVYESETFYEFFDWLQSKNNFIDIMEGTTYFDYLLYSIWLIIFKGFKIKKLCNDKVFDWAALEVETDLDIINEFKSLISKSQDGKYTKIIIHKDRK